MKCSRFDHIPIMLESAVTNGTLNYSGLLMFGLIIQASRNQLKKNGGNWATRHTNENEKYSRSFEEMEYKGY